MRNLILEEGRKVLGEENGRNDVQRDKGRDACSYVHCSYGRRHYITQTSSVPVASSQEEGNKENGPKGKGGRENKLVDTCHPLSLPPTRQEVVRGRDRVLK